MLLICVTGADVLSAMVRESRSQSNWKNTVDTRQRWDMTCMEVEKTLDLVGFTNVVFKLTKIMLDAEADASDNTQLELPNMLLLVECEAGHLKLAKMLLGADASTSNKQGNTPLLAVTQQGDVELLKILKAAMSETAEAVAVASAASRWCRPFVSGYFLEEQRRHQSCFYVRTQTFRRSRKSRYCS